MESHADDNEAESKDVYWHDGMCEECECWNQDNGKYGWGVCSVIVYRTHKDSPCVCLC